MLTTHKQVFKITKQRKENTSFPFSLSFQTGSLLTFKREEKYYDLIRFDMISLKFDLLDPINVVWGFFR